VSVFVWGLWVCLCGVCGFVCVGFVGVFVWGLLVCLCGVCGCVCVGFVGVLVWGLWVCLCGICGCVRQEELDSWVVCYMYECLDV